MWPVLANIVEIPPPYRHYQQNTMMLSIWHSPRSASAPVLFERIIQDLLQLVQHGLDIEFDDLGSIHFDVFIQGVCADGPGQSKITDIVSHNGYYACRVCEMHGCYITGDNTCTCPWSLFERTSPPFRTRDRFEYCINEIKRLKAMGNRNINVMGIKNISPLNDIIFIPTQSIYDYMHLCLVGHTTIILKECNDYHPGSSKQANSIIGEFDHFLSNIQYPHNINRKVKNFRCFNDWKAAQIRIFLLYLSLPFIQYQTHYFPPLIVFHFSLYAIYIRTLCKFTDRQQIYDVRIFIENHLRRFKQFYTKSKELLSTHCNMHLWQQVIRHGALSATSMFGSESCLHGLYKLAHGTKNIGEQVAYWYTIHRHVHFISFPNQRDINHQGHFMDHYVDERVIQDYKIVIFKFCFYLLLSSSVSSVLHPKKMSTIHTYRTNASQHVATTASSMSQHPHLSQEQQSSQYHHSSQQQHTQHHRVSMHSSSIDTGSYYGPVRSSLALNQQHTTNTTYNPHRASPYTVNSPRMLRRQGGTSYPDDGTLCSVVDNENSPPSNHVSVAQHSIEKLVERCTSLENEMKALQTKTDKLLKITLITAKKDQDITTTKPKSKPNPIVMGK
ncbi:unnamed protein product [Rotaria magnacalcarata]|uniref:Uncharacterized protein n=2 Tax=Rotaria magnacalcarata TaxID=392030 RepID=A0A8S2QKP2_9BILA|nr:unnamed protein product [Rotaria magnacalcarata]